MKQVVANNISDIDNNINNESIIIGRLGAPHGINGWISVQSYTDPVTNIFNWQNWWLALPKNASCKSDALMQVTVVELKPKSNKFIVKLAEINDRNAAQAVVNHNILIPRSDLPQLAANEYYWNDLVGFTVSNDTDGKSLGLVYSFFDTAAHPIMVVKNDNNETLIPFVFDVHVLDINNSKKEIIVSWEI